MAPAVANTRAAAKLLVETSHKLKKARMSQSILCLCLFRVPLKHSHGVWASS